MRIEIVEDAGEASPSLVFPPTKNYLDLRENPQALERIAPAREHLPLRNFLAAVNSAGSVFASASIATESRAPGAASATYTHEFESRVVLVFAAPSLNYDPDQYAGLAEKLKDLLGRDAGEETRGQLRIPSCYFSEHHLAGYCLCVCLIANGDSAKQAELRWGLATARMQQALMFCSRALGQQKEA